MARIVCLGSSCQNIYCVKNQDNPQDILERMTYCTDGGGLNSAVACARYGHEVILFSNIGKDLGAEAVMETLDCENIDSSYMHCLQDYQTGGKITFSEFKKNANQILIYGGAMQKFDNFNPKDLDLIHPDWLYIASLNGDFDILEKFCNYAKKIHCKVMFNPGQAELKQQEKLLKILAKVDVLLVNKDEAMQIVHGQLLGELVEQLQKYTKTVIITDGIMGSISKNEYQTLRLGSYSNVKMVDLTGAGDAFGAGFLAAYANGESFGDSLIFASANASAVIEQIGPHAGMLNSHVQLHPMPMQIL